MLVEIVRIIFTAIVAIVTILATTGYNMVIRFKIEKATIPRPTFELEAYKKNDTKQKEYSDLEGFSPRHDRIKESAVKSNFMQRTNALLERRCALDEEVPVRPKTYHVFPKLALDEEVPVRPKTYHVFPKL